MKRIREQKDAPANLLDNIGGKTFFKILEERFTDAKKDWLKDMEQFIYETCETLYTNATKDIKLFPATWKDLLKELPFDVLRHDSFIEEYSNAKNEVIDNYRFNLKNEKEKRKKKEIEYENFDEVMKVIFTKILEYNPQESDLPSDIKNWIKKRKMTDDEKKLLFKNLWENVLEGKTLTQIKAELDTAKTEVQHYHRIKNKLTGKVSDTDLDALLNSVPSCSHTDYNTIKEELATSKKELTEAQEKLEQQKVTHEKEKKVAQNQKEQQIINKIITDLELSTERERERTF